MERYEDDYYFDYLAHHGIKGMKWGIRRFQRKDGSLTSEGRKRRSLGQVIKDHKTAKKRKAALEKAREAKVAKKTAEEKQRLEFEKRKKAIDKGRISPEKMTSEELQYAINRKKAIDDYNRLQLQTSVSKRFINNAWNKAVEPALLDAGKSVLTKFMSEKATKLLGLEAKKSVREILKEQSEITKYKREIAENEKALKKMKSNEPDPEEEYKKVKRDAEMARYKRTTYADTKAYNEMKAEDEKSKSEQGGDKKTDIGKDTVNNSTSLDVSAKLFTDDDSIKESGQAWVENYTGELLGKTSWKEM